MRKSKTDKHLSGRQPTSLNANFHFQFSQYPITKLTFHDIEIQPGKDIQSDDDIDNFIKNSVESAYHPCCSCKMGSDNDSVVDNQTRVIGLSGLRVVDASIFPDILNGNLNAPTMMVAEKAADMILKKTPPR